VTDFHSRSQWSWIPTAREASDAAKDALQAFHRNVCRNCGQRIRIMINRGTGWCSEQCRKALADE